MRAVESLAMNFANKEEGRLTIQSAWLSEDRNGARMFRTPLAAFATSLARGRQRRPPPCSSRG